MTKIKLLLDASGYKQRYVAKALGVEETLMSHYVSGRRAMPPDLIKSIAKFLKVKASDVEGVVG